MKLSEIRKLQKEHGVWELQSAIDSGEAWHTEEKSKVATEALMKGECMLPKFINKRWHDNMLIPCRQILQKNTVGTFGHCEKYWIERTKAG